MPTPVVTVRQFWVKSWQTGTPAALISGSNPFTPTAGNTLVALQSGWDATRQVPMPTDSTGAVFAIPTNAAQNANIAGVDFWLEAGVLPNATGVAHTITPALILDGAGGSNGEMNVWILEISNMPTGTTVRDCVGVAIANGSLSWSGSTSNGGLTTPQVNDVVLALTCYENSAATVSANLTDPPTGFTSIGVQNDATTNLPTEAAYQVVTSAGQKTAAWTTTDANKTHHATIMLTLVPINTSIVVTTPPVSTNVTQGGFATFGVSISGATGTAHYQWAVDGENVGTDSSTLVYQPSVSKTSSVTVTITDDIGSITTTPVAMRVFRVPAPAKVRKYRPIYGVDGSGLSLFANNLLASAIDPSQISLATSGGGSGINASLNVTEGADTVSSAVAVLVTATDSSTEGSDTSSATTGVLVTTTLSATEGSDSVSASSAVLVNTTASITEAGDTVSASTTSLIAASASITETSDTLSATAAVLVTSSNSDTEGSDTVSASTAVAVVATLSATEGVDTLSSLTGAGAISASLTVTEGSDSVSSTVAVLVTSTSSVTEAPDSLTSTTGVLVQTSAAMTEGSDSVSATVSSVIGVSLSATESNDTLTASSAVGITANLTATEGADTLSATAGAPAAVVNLDVTEGSDSVSSVVTALVTGSVNATEGADTTSGATSVLVSASASITEAPDGLAAGVAVGVVVNASVTEAPDTLNSTVGSPAINASVNVTEDADLVASSGIVIVGVSASVVESPDTGISSASVAVTANVAVVESRDTSFGNSGVVVTASLNVVEHSDSISSFIQTVVEEGLIYIDPGLQPYTNGDLVYYTSRSQIGT